MIKLIFIPLIFVFYLSMGQTENTASIIGKPAKIGNLHVAQKDFTIKMTWDDAKKACKALGFGWRLPTKTELKILDTNTFLIRAFASHDYWSSTAYVSYFAWDQSFISSLDYDAGIYARSYVRAVKGDTLEPSNIEYNNIIGKTIKIGKIEIAQYDFPIEMKWYDAEKACRVLGKGWRLPTKSELSILYKNRSKIGGFKYGGITPGGDTKFNHYWSSTEIDGDFAWDLDFNDGYENGNNKYYFLYVRAIRSF